MVYSMVTNVQAECTSLNKAVSHEEIVKFDECPTKGVMLPMNGLLSPKYVRR